MHFIHMERDRRQASTCLRDLDRLLAEGRFSREGLIACKASVEAFMHDRSGDVEQWRAIERRCAGVFEQVDQEIEFNSKCRWSQVESLLISLAIVQKARLKIAVFCHDSEAVGSLYAGMAYRCQISTRFAVDGLINDRQLAFVKSQIDDVADDCRLLWASYDRPGLTGDQRDACSKSRITEILAVLGLTDDGVKDIRPALEFVNYIPFWKDYWTLTVMLDSLVVAQLCVEVRPIMMIGELVISHKLYMKYQQQKDNNDRKLEMESIKWLVKMADKLITEQSDAASSYDEFITFKSALKYLSPSDIRIADRLECLYKIKVGDYKELLKYKQSLNLSNPADILFDLVIDLFRMSLPNAGFNNSAKVLLHKLSTPGVSQLLNFDFLQACRPFFEGISGFPYLLLVQASLSFDPQLLLLYLRSIATWLEAVREQIRAKVDIENIVSQYFSEISLAKIDSMVEKDTRVGAQEAKWLIIKCSFISFYLAKLIKDYNRATSCLQILFKHSDSMDNLWEINQESGSFFLDVLQVISEKDSDIGSEILEGTTMDVEQSIEQKECKTILKFLILISEPRINDTPRIKAYKSAIKMKLELRGLSKTRSSDTRTLDLSLFTGLPFEEICSVFKSELSTPGLYYAFFFNALSSYLESGEDDSICIRSMIQFMVVLYEEMMQSLTSAELSSVQAILPVLCEKISDRGRQSLGSDLADRLAVHLYNTWCISQTSAAICQAVKLAGIGGRFDAVTAAFVYDAIKTSNFESLEAGLLSDISVWCDQRLSGHLGDKLKSIAVTNTSQKGMEIEAENDFLAELEKLEKEHIEVSTPIKSTQDGLSKAQLLYIKVVCLYHSNRENFSNELSQIISKFGNKMTKEEYSALFFATQSFSDKSIQNQFLRHYLSKLLSTGEADTAGMLEIYEALLESTDSVRELKTYLIQMVGVIEMIDPNDKSISPATIKSLVLQLAKVKEDFQSLSEQISKIAGSIAEKWNEICLQTKGVSRVLAFIREVSV